MANSSYVDYKLIEYFKETEKQLKNNNIVPIYKEHLKQLDICVEIFSNLEENRSFCNLICDWADGERNKINVLRMLRHLCKLKRELINGIQKYENLLELTEDMKNIVSYIDNSNSKRIIHKRKKVDEISFKNHLGRGAMCAGGGALVGGIVGAGIGYSGLSTGLLVKCGLLKASATTLQVTAVTAGIGAIALGATALVIYSIYSIAKSYGKERGLKYHQVRAFSEALNVDYLSSIRADHETMGSMFQGMVDVFVSKDMKLALARSIYEESKQASFQELEREGEIDSAMYKMMSEKCAKKRCKYLFTVEFGNYCSEKEIEEILNEF